MEKKLILKGCRICSPYLKENKDARGFKNKRIHGR